MVLERDSAMKVLFRGVQFFIAKWLAMCLGCPLFLRCAKTNRCTAHNDGWAWIRLGNLYCSINGFDIVAIVHFLDVPAIGFKACTAIFGECQRSGSINRDVIVIIEINDSSKL